MPRVFRRLPSGSLQKGFTLIELLVSVAILAIISLGAYSFISSTSSSALRLQERQARLLAVARLQGVIAQDLSQWVNRPVRDELGDALPPFVLETEGALEFTRRGLSNPLDKQRSDLIRVRYEMRGNRLWRLSWNTLDRLPGQKPLASPLGPGGLSLRWRVQDGPNTPVLAIWPPISAGANASNRNVVTEGAPEVVDLQLKVAPWGDLRRVYLLPGHDAL